MKLTRDERNQHRIQRETEAKAYLLGGIRTDGKVDVGACFRDKDLMGALATLEESGEIARAGPIDGNHHQPYHLAESDEERQHFRAERIKADRANWDRHPKQEPKP